MFLGSLIYIALVAWYLFDDNIPSTTSVRSDEDYEDNLIWLDY